VLTAFIYVYETKALDDALDLLDMLITEIMAMAHRSGEKNRLRTLGDLDKAALELSEVCATFLLYKNSPDLQNAIYQLTTVERMTAAIDTVKTIARPKHDRYYKEIIEQYKKVRRFLPSLLKTICFSSTQAGSSTKEAVQFLLLLEGKRQPSMGGSMEEVPKFGISD